MGQKSGMDLARGMLGSLDPVGAAANAAQRVGDAMERGPTANDQARARGVVNQADDSVQATRMRSRAAANNAAGGLRGTTGDIGRHGVAKRGGRGTTAQEY